MFFLENLKIGTKMEQIMTKNGAKTDQIWNNATKMDQRLMQKLIQKLYQNGTKSEQTMERKWNKN